jgi:hypothetical protein
VYVTYAFTRLAVVVRRWFEIGPDAVMEHGARVELRLVDPRPHRGTESAAQPTVIDEAVWRADLFGRLDRPDAPFSAAHFHPFFDGVEPSDRHWSAELTADPWAWLTDRLAHVEDVLAEAGVDRGPAADDADDLRAAVPTIVATARGFSPERPATRDDDFRLTRDAAERVRRMVALIPETVPYDRDHVRPWLDAADGTRP